MFVDIIQSISTNKCDLRFYRKFKHNESFGRTKKKGTNINNFISKLVKHLPKKNFEACGYRIRLIEKQVHGIFADVVNDSDTNPIINVTVCMDVHPTIPQNLVDIYTIDGIIPTIGIIEKAYYL